MPRHATRHRWICAAAMVLVGAGACRQSAESAPQATPSEAHPVDAAAPPRVVAPPEPTSATTTGHLAGSGASTNAEDGEASGPSPTVDEPTTLRCKETERACMDICCPAGSICTHGRSADEATPKCIRRR